MQITVHPFTVHKKTPLTISRGTHHASTNLWVKVTQDGIEGWGEATAFSIGDHYQTSEKIQAELNFLKDALVDFHPLDRQTVETWMLHQGIGSATRAAVDVALHDWAGKRVGMPLWQLWGLNRQQIQPTSVTIGISSPEQAQQRLEDWLSQFPIQAIKVKLGSPQGIEADQAMMNALLSQSPPHVALSVDANGGWSLSEAKVMAEWLAERGVLYLEQPLSIERSGEFALLYAQAPLPIFVDESCFTSQDIPTLAPYVHGINIKLMKAGGLTEAYRMIQVARAFGLKVMFGCYSDSALSNTAMAHLSPLADHLDLDSHFNLVDDPFRGALLDQGTLYPPDQPGLGVTQDDAP